jgi:DNA-binding CsgD family transcriptional regulator
MEAFARRARAELRTAGEYTAERPAGTPDVLTPQEAQIARLFVSASTVDYHLREVFRRLGITSRVRLAHALSALDAAVG